MNYFFGFQLKLFSFKYFIHIIPTLSLLILVSKPSGKNKKQAIVKMLW